MWLPEAGFFCLRKQRRIMVREFDLKNGLHVVYEPMEQVRTVSFGVWVQAGSAYETKENNGISHMIEHMLFKGTNSRTAGDIADETAALGGNLNAYTGKEYTAYYLKTLDDQLEASMDLISDMLKASAFREEQLATEKQVVIDEISMYNDSCEDMVHEKLQKKVWKGHPLGYIISGKKRTIRAFTRHEIMDFWRLYYTAGRMLICVAGHINEGSLKEQLERYFGDIPSGRLGNELTVPVYGAKQFRRFREIEQVHLDIAMPGLVVDAPERYAFSLANSILGGSVSSRLFQKIREAEGRAYSIYSYGSNFCKAGLWQIYAATNAKELDSAINDTFDLIRQMKKEGVTAAELTQAKRELRAEVILGNESPQARMDNLAKSVLCYGRVISPEETLEGLDRVTEADISAFMEQWADVEQASVCVMGNYEG